MAVNKVDQGKDDQNAEKKEVEAKEDGLMDDILKTMDLPADEDEKDSDTDDDDADDSDDDADDDSKDDDDTDDSDDDSDDDADDDADDDKDEDLVPKSKVKKIEEKTARRIAAKERRIRELESQLEERTSPRDSDLDRLEKMSLPQLKQLRRECRKEQRDADDDRLDKLVDLEEKIDDTIRTTPDRFMKEQVARYDKAAEEILEDEGGEISKEVAQFLKAKAVAIYQGSNTLQKSKSGQAEALKLAYEHYKEIQKASKGRSGDKKLKRTVNKLKRKTSLDSSSGKSSKKVSTHLKKLRDKAFRGGDAHDKEKLIEADPRFNIDSLIPEEYKD